jgi:hypothetical protein
MRAPGQKFVAYTEEQWQRIRDTVRAGLGLDADRMTCPGDQGTINVTFLHGGDRTKWRRGTLTYVTRHDAAPPPDFILPECEMTLRTAVQRMAARVYRRPEPDRSLPKLRKRIDELHEMLSEHGEEYAEEAETLEALSLRIRHRARLHNDARFNAYDAQRIRLLRDFINLWIELGGKPTGKAAESFVVACIEPRLGTAATKGVAKWLERYRCGRVYFHWAREVYSP